MQTTPPNYRVIIVGDWTPTDHSFRLVIADTAEGVIDDCRIPIEDMRLDSADTLLTMASANAAGAPEVTLIVDRLPLWVFDDGDDKARLAEFGEEAKAAGWTAGAGLELGSGWITWQKTGHAIVHLGIRRLMDPGDPDAMVKASDPLDVLAERLNRYGQLMGTPYRSTPGVSGTAMLRNLYDRPKWIKPKGEAGRWGERRQPRWVWTPRDGYNQVPHLTGTGPLIWQRKPTTFEETMPHVVAFDVRASYLAAAAGTPFGWDAPRPVGAVPFEPSASGFWRVYLGTGAQLPDWARAERGVPIINPNRIAADGTTWVTTPIMRYISERGHVLPEVIDAWISAESGLLLQEWAERIRGALPDAMTAGDHVLRQAVKSTYTQALTQMGTPGGRITRRDITQTVMDDARVRILRKVHKVADGSDGTIQPLKIKVDCVWYATAYSDGVDLLSRLEPRRFSEGRMLAPTIGQFKLDRGHSGTMREYLDGARQRAAASRIRRDPASQ